MDNKESPIPPPAAKKRRISGEPKDDEEEVVEKEARTASAETRSLPLQGSQKATRFSSSTATTHDGDNDTKTPAPATAAVAEPKQQQQQQQQQQHQQEKLPPLETSRLYIGGLHPRVTQTHVEKLMTPYGTIQDVRLVVKQQQQHQSGGRGHRGGPTAISTNFAFCQYASIAQAEAAMKALHGRMLLGKRLMVRPANQQQHSSSAIYRRYETHRDQQQQQQSSGASSASAAAAAGGTPGGDARQEKQEMKKIDSKIEAIKRKLQK